MDNIVQRRGIDLQERHRKVLRQTLSVTHENMSLEHMENTNETQSDVDIIRKVVSTVTIGFLTALTMVLLVIVCVFLRRKHNYNQPDAHNPEENLDSDSENADPMQALHNYRHHLGLTESSAPQDKPVELENQMQQSRMNLLERGESLIHLSMQDLSQREVNNWNNEVIPSQGSSLLYGDIFDDIPQNRNLPGMKSLQNQNLSIPSCSRNNNKQEVSTVHDTRCQDEKNMTPVEMNIRDRLQSLRQMVYNANTKNVKKSPRKILHCRELSLSASDLSSLNDDIVQDDRSSSTINLQHVPMVYSTIVHGGCSKGYVNAGMDMLQDDCYSSEQKPAIPPKAFQSRQFPEIKLTLH